MSNKLLSSNKLLQITCSERCCKKSWDPIRIFHDEGQGADGVMIPIYDSDPQTA